MPLRIILLPLDGRQSNDAAWHAALALARRFAAHLEVLHVRADPRDAIPFMTGVTSASLIEMIIADAERSAAERAAKARDFFEARRAAEDIANVETPPAPDTVSAAWREETGREAAVLVARARLADIVVMARPSENASASETLETVLMESGRPVLVAPPAPREALAGTVAIGWDGDAEAARAVAAAMPLLAAAEAVSVVTVEEEATPRTAPDDLVQHLAWHDIAATPQRVKRGDRSVGEALLAAASDGGADLLVVGGYGHSRARELILGGVTRHLLAAAEIPVLMVH